MTRRNHGRVCYMEIPAKDVAKSSAFYARLFDWKLRARGDGAQAFDDANGYVSGVWVPEKDAGPDFTTVTYVQVDSIDEALQKVGSAGGKVIEGRTAIDPSGKYWFAIVHDPSGNRLGLYEEKA